MWRPRTFRPSISICFDGGQCRFAHDLPADVDTGKSSSVNKASAIEPEIPFFGVRPAFEIAGFGGARRLSNLAIRIRGFPSRPARCSGGASEGTMRPKKHETTGRSDLFRARLDEIINHAARTGVARGQDRLGAGSTARSRRCSATRAGPRLKAGSCSGCCCSSTSSRCRMKRCASAGSTTPISSLHRGGVLPARLPARAHRPKPLAQAARRQARAAPGRQLAGGARPARYAAKTSNGSRSTPRCSRRRSPSRPTPSCCMRQSGD